MASTTDGEYTAEQEITVFPVITTVEIDGTVAVGQTVKAKVYALGGAEYDYENYPALSLQWKYLTADDYSGNTGSSSYQTISGATGREFTIPEDLEGNYLSFTLRYDREDKTPSRPVKVASSSSGILTARQIGSDSGYLGYQRGQDLDPPNQRGEGIFCFLVQR